MTGVCSDGIKIEIEIGIRIKTQWSRSTMIPYPQIVLFDHKKTDRVYNLIKFSKHTPISIQPKSILDIFY